MHHYSHVRLRRLNHELPLFLEKLTRNDSGLLTALNYFSLAMRLSTYNDIRLSERSAADDTAGAYEFTRKIGGQRGRPCVCSALSSALS